MDEYISREEITNRLHVYAITVDKTNTLSGVLRNIVRDTPAADVRPVVRGKWKADGDGYHWTYNCSICGWKDGYPFNERHKFCPNCGADMLWEADHDQR